VALSVAQAEAPPHHQSTPCHADAADSSTDHGRTTALPVAPRLLQISQAASGKSRHCRHVRACQGTRERAGPPDHTTAIPETVPRAGVGRDRRERACCWMDRCRCARPAGPPHGSPGRAGSLCTRARRHGLDRLIGRTYVAFNRRKGGASAVSGEGPAGTPHRSKTLGGAGRLLCRAIPGDESKM
jgi:hypothetical protein